MTSVPATVRVRGLAKAFTSGREAVRILDGVDMDIAPGEAVAVTGPSGSGKSTLLYCIGALMRPTSGRVEVAGQEPWRLSDRARSRLRARRIGFVFQSYHLMPDLSVLENCLIAARIAGTRHADGRAMGLLRQLGLEALASARPPRLSGGEAQRAAIARALVNEADVLLCDEPTGNLDPANRTRVLDVLSRVGRTDGRSLLIVTHDEAAARTADRVLKLENGILSER